MRDWLQDVVGGRIVRSHRLGDVRRTSGIFFGKWGQREPQLIGRAVDVWVLD
ncbi:MAG: hypothetical protein NZ899_01670 [Thermoguttaceae bacterium]|nr:hypothetical protein [Thermoguttaceae bacterium]MDW8078644.1 hypothetical protein [Thermoguttaceae bacterium]